MKIEFVDGTLSTAGSNFRWMKYDGRRIAADGVFSPAGSTDIEYKKDKTIITEHKKNHILVVKQPTLTKTAFVLFHELCHWLVHRWFKHNYLARKKWHKRIDDYLQ